MASEVSSMPNGNYAPQQHGFDQQQANNAYASQNYNQAPAASNPPAPAANTQSEIPKDEVGWYFVEQYYTTLSRTPEKLYLYYNKRSQFVSGNETDKVQVCVGQRAINDRIKELEFQDCKVRITNVDSQASDINIVIQVIGEISNKSQPHRKFTQTFVLATQTNGYFVLNDIFRYMIEEEEEVAAAEPTKVEKAEEVQQESAAEASGIQEPAPIAEETEPKTLPSSEDKAAVEQAAQVVDKELQEKVVEKEQAKEEPKAEESAPAVNGAEETKEEAATEQPAAEEAPAAVEVEEPRDPEPTPVTEEPPKAAKPAAPAPVKPAVPKTWASLAASANKSVAMPAAPSAAPAAAPVQAAKPAAAKSAPTATPAQSSATASSVSAAQREASPATAAAATSGDEWTAVSGNHNRQQSRQVNGQQQQQQEPSHPRGYIKNVQENIKGPEMKEKLAQFGEINYFDIYRAKSCAFVDFKTPEGYKNALAASPFQIGDEKFWIEERRTNRPGTQQQQQQFNGQRGNFQQGQRGGRGNFRGDGGRGGFGQRGGRGGAGGAARGRGGAAGAPAA